MKWFLAGNRGLVGTNFSNVYQCSGVNTSTCNLEDYQSTLSSLQLFNPTHVMINAASVGGLMDDINNSFDLYIKNLTIQNNIFKACKALGIKNVLLQGSTCMYPAEITNKYIEEDIWTGKPLEQYFPTALPKLIGYKQCISAKENWKTAILTNLFGPHDKVGEIAHAVGALMQKFVKNNGTIIVWGSGKQERDFLYVKDAITAFDLIMNSNYDAVNIASGTTISIEELINILIDVSQFKGKIKYDTTKPEGILTRKISNDRLKSLGWKPKYSLQDALAETYKWYYDNT